MSIRDLKTRARSALHMAMAVNAVYVDLDSDPRQEVPCRVRVHDRTQTFGDMAGFDYAPAEVIATVPQVVFLVAEVRPGRGGIVSVSPDEAYEVEVPMPRDGITLSAQVTRMSQQQIDALALPVPAVV